MRSRLLHVAVVVTGLVLFAGFVALIQGALATDRGVDTYRDSIGLPPRDGLNRWAPTIAGYVAGLLLTVLVVALGATWRRVGGRPLRRALSLALLAGVALGLLLAIDGLVNLAPSGDLEGVVPSWYAPLSTAQGLITTAVCGLALIGLPSRPRCRRARTGRSAAGCAS